MADGNFFDALGVRLSKATHTAVDRTGVFLSSTRINAQIAGEQREAEKLYQKLGETVFSMAEAGEIRPEGEVKRLIEKIKNHKSTVAGYRRELAGVKNQRICPRCGAFIDTKAVFCQKCGEEIPEETPAAQKPGQTAAPVDTEIEIEEAVSLDGFEESNGGMA